MPTMTPGEAWETLLEGNRRFVAGEVKHPNQDIEHRGRLEQSQDPIALIFGCGDSRVASELIFDQGLGDLFVVRTAGHVSVGGVVSTTQTWKAAVVVFPAVSAALHTTSWALPSAKRLPLAGVQETARSPPTRSSAVAVHS